MSLTGLSSLLDLPGAALAYVGAKLANIFLSLGTFSLASWCTALCVAVLFLGLRRPKARRNIKLRVLVRALFPRKLLHSPSSAADVWFFVFNFFLAGVLLSWAIVSYHLVSSALGEVLVARFGALQPTLLPKAATIAILTVALFLAYELGYWIDHYLAHNIPFLWEFHKVHHQAEVLSPLTNFRVHPVDSIVFYNIQAVVMGTTGGLVTYGLGEAVQPFTIAGSNVLVLIFTYLVGHLQHSQFWIAFTGVWGRLFLSPAHHQIHHSTNPVHFNKNLGACLGIWDWLFGTLHMPGRKREKLTFGVEPMAGNVHGLNEGLVAPVVRAFALINPLQQVRRGGGAGDAGSQRVPLHRRTAA